MTCSSMSPRVPMADRQRDPPRSARALSLGFVRHELGGGIRGTAHVGSRVTVARHLEHQDPAVLDLPQRVLRSAPSL
jgi:hypothetical protein